MKRPRGKVDREVTRGTRGLSWVTLDRICQEKVAPGGFPRELTQRQAAARVAAPLSDDELLAKLRELGLDVDRDGVERLCEEALVC